MAKGFFDYMQEVSPIEQTEEERAEAEQLYYDAVQGTADREAERIRRTDKKKHLAELVQNNATLFELATEALYCFGDAVNDPAWAAKQCSILNEKWSGILREQVEHDARAVTLQELEARKRKDLARIEKLLTEQSAVMKKAAELKRMIMCGAGEQATAEQE